MPASGSGVSRVGSWPDGSTASPAHDRRSTTIADNTYNAAHLLVLEGLEAVRKRPGMYIGSTDTRGLMHCLWEIIDNGVDEALAGAGDLVEVTLHPDGSAEVHDDGRGIPTDKEPKTGLPGRRGGRHQAARRRQVRRRRPTSPPAACTASALSVVNALSARMDIDVDRVAVAAGHELPARCARASSTATARRAASRRSRA